MKTRPVLDALCLFVVGASILIPAQAGAVTLQNHVSIPHGVTMKDPAHAVVVWTVAPPDSDDDGYADTDDDCPDEAYSGNGGCIPPPPPAPVVPQVSAPTPYPTTTATSCPSYMAAEATSPTDVNSSSGASGCWQVLPSTADLMGPACSDVNSYDCLNAICAAQGDEAWAASGATPCS